MNRHTRYGLVLLMVAFVGAAGLGAAIYWKMDWGPRPATPARQQAGVVDNEQLRLRLAQLPLRFEANRGQTDAQVDFLARGSGYSLFLTSSEAVFSMSRAPAPVAPRPRNSAGGPEAASGAVPAVLRMQIVGARPSQAEGLEELPGRSNYFLGNDPSKWRQGVVPYGKVRYTGVYPGIDLLYYGNQNQLEYDFVVAPGADPRQIRLAFAGARKLSTDEVGDLVVAGSNGEVRWQRPRIYQENDGRRVKIPGEFFLHGGNEVGFQIGRYDRARPLIIDPVLSFATYLGGSNSDMAGRIAVDTSGNVYVSGSTSSTDFPTQTPIQGAAQGGGDIFITKMNPAGTAIVYSTYLGGSGGEFSGGLAVDAQGNVYVSGSTMSSNFPTVNPFQAAKRGFDDAFVAKLNPAGDALVFSTYLGGSRSFEGAWGIAADNGGNVYVLGTTISVDFPTVNAFQAAKGGDSCEFPPCFDVFVAKLNPTGSNLLYSTYLGGSGDENFQMFGGLAVDGAGNVSITGITESFDFPTKSPLQANLRGIFDAYVAKFDPTQAGAASLVYSTYLGGGGSDGGSAIAADTMGNAYVLGAAGSNDFPTTDGVLSRTRAGDFDAFVAKLNPAGTALVFSTYLGGSGNDALDLQTGGGIALDSAGNVFVAWTTTSADFPVVNALQVSLRGPRDAYVAKLDAAATRLIYSTYLGGTGPDHGMGLAVSPQGGAYVAGYTASTDFPTTDNAFDRTCGSDGRCDLQQSGMSFLDGFAAMVAEPTGAAPSLSPTSLDFGSQLVGTTSGSRTATLFNGGNAALAISAITVTGDFAATDTCGSSLSAGGSCTINVTFTPSAAGAQTGMLSVSTDAPNSPHSASLSGTGVVPAPGLVVSPSSLAFGNQLLGTASAPQTITLTNSGTAFLNILQVGLTGADASEFALATTCAGGMDVGQSCTASVTLSPISAGVKSASLVVTSDAPGSPHAVALSGTGVTPPAAVLSTSSLNFGPQIVNTTSAPQTVTLSNPGGSPLAISGLSLGGTHAAHFSYTDNCGASLNPGASCAINVTVRPTEVGACAASLAVVHNASGSPSTIEISGMATDFAISAPAGSPTSATVNAGEAATFQTSLVGSTGFSGSVSLACTGAPATMSCSVSPTSVALNGTTPASATLTVTTTARAALPPLPREWPLRLPGVLTALAALAALALLRFAGSAPSLRPVWVKAVRGTALAIVLLLAGCGGGGGGSSSTPPRPSGTPAGTYSITVQATTSGATRTLTFSVTVR